MHHKLLDRIECEVDKQTTFAELMIMPCLLLQMSMQVLMILYANRLYFTQLLCIRTANLSP